MMLFLFLQICSAYLFRAALCELISEQQKDALCHKTRAEVPYNDEQSTYHNNQSCKKFYGAGPGSEKPRVYYREVIQKTFWVILEIITTKTANQVKKNSTATSDS